MTDRELLEMAAKAAGMRYTKPTDDYSGSYGLALCDEHGRHTRSWSPLTDDGDALRLAVKLGIGLQWGRAGRIYAYKDKVEACYVSRGSAEENTRRAIVRAAADIGAEKPSA